jgi:uncharacterized protein YjeT (DUF2065 family)
MPNVPVALGLTAVVEGVLVFTTKGFRQELALLVVVQHKADV